MQVYTVCKLAFLKQLSKDNWEKAKLCEQISGFNKEKPYLSHQKLKVTWKSEPKTKFWAYWIFFFNCKLVDNTETCDASTALTTVNPSWEIQKCSVPTSKAVNGLMIRNF